MAADEKTNLERRRFMREASFSAGTVVTLAFLFGLPAKQVQAQTAQCLPPPGALTGEAFAAACIRCGQCVQACPYDTLMLATASTGITVGLPYFIARHIPCEMCEQIYCIEACPTGALDPKLTNIDDARMGLSVLLDQENCIAWQGLRCEACYNACPLEGKAITIDRRSNERTGHHSLYIPVVNSAYCTGCGKCEQACVLEESAIKVLPIDLAKGEDNKHYRFGWKEKEKAGHALFDFQPKMEIRHPENSGGGADGQ